MGRFDTGEDVRFFADLQSFYDVTYRHVFDASAPSIVVGGSTDTYKVSGPLKRQSCLTAVIPATKVIELPTSLKADQAKTHWLTGFARPPDPT